MKIEPLHIHQRQLIIFLFILCESLGLQAQESLRGTVYNKNTKQPIPFTTVSIPHTGTGVITNEFGEFIYHIPADQKNDIIKISHIGYESINTKIENIELGKTCVFRMIPKQVDIDEVEIFGIKGIPASKIVKRAIKNIPQNYPRETFHLSGYYRDYIRDIETNDYKNLTEAAIRIEDKGFDTRDYARSRIMIEQIRYSPEYLVDSMLNREYDSNTKYVPHANVDKSNDLAFLLLQNPIRNYKAEAFSFIYNFKTKFIRNHDFRYESFIDNDSTRIFEVEFDTYRIINKKQYWVNGKIYINEEDYAILKFEYYVSCKIPSYSGLFLELNIEYKKYENKYFLNYISFGNYFEFSPNTSTDADLTIEHLFHTSTDADPTIEHLFQFREFFANKIETDTINHIENDECIRKNKTLISNEIITIPNFWETYNYTLNKEQLR